MADVYETVEIEDMAFDGAEKMYTYPCPCGDTFRISLDELLDGEEIATCPSCTLTIRVIYDVEKLTRASKKASEGMGSSISAHDFMKDVYSSVDKDVINRGESKGGEAKEGSGRRDYKDGSSKDEK